MLCHNILKCHLGIKIFALLQRHFNMDKKDNPDMASTQSIGKTKESTPWPSTSSSAGVKRMSEKPVAYVGGKVRRTTEPSDDSWDDSLAPVRTGFDRGLMAEKILGIYNNNGRRTFRIQFAGVDQAEMVPSNVANVRIPQMVIAFYTENLCWGPDNED